MIELGSNNLRQLSEQQNMIHKQTEIEAWGEARGMYEQSSAEAQSEKLWEEFDETGEAITQGIVDGRKGIKDGVGDVHVVLAHIARFWGIPLEPAGPIPSMSADFSRQFYGIAYGAMRAAFSPAVDDGSGELKEHRARLIRLALDNLAGVAACYGFTVADAIDYVLPEINARTGKFINGIYVKDA